MGLTRVHALRAGPSGWKSPHVISQREGLVLVAGGRGAGAIVTLAAPPLTHPTCAASSQEASALGTGSPPCGAFVNKPTSLPLADVTCGNKPWKGQDRKGRALHQVEVKGYSSCTRKHKVEFPSGKQLNFLKQEHWEE